jgi:uncharacterized protein YfkK (UPF0435 family)
MIDLPSASLNELRTIHDMAEHFGAAAYAWESCCRPRTGRQGDPEFNQAGKLMSWLGDALAAVETEIRKETQRRVPDNALDQETRLAMLAVQTIENGSPDEVDAFARELLEIAEADRATEALASALRARAQAEPESR